MEKAIIRKKEYPLFSVADFKDFKSLLLKLKDNIEHPAYKNMSEINKAFIDAFKETDEINKKRKKYICSNFNKLLKDYALYVQLKKYYGKNYLNSKLSEETRQYRDDLQFLDKPSERLRRHEKTKTEWLNLYLLTELYPDELHKIQRKGKIRAWAESIIVAIALAVFVRTFFFQIYKIPTPSMVPTLMRGDKIFVSKLVYGPKVPFTSLRFPGFKRPQRGEVIVFIPPNDRKKAYIKRLIGLEGERVLIKDGDIYINGKKITDARIARNLYCNQGDHGKENKETLVPAGKYFFLGDNSNSSLDSRWWGFVDEKDIIGKAIFIWWPPKRIGIIG
jgi:signal peptidase I